MKKIQKFF